MTYQEVTDKLKQITTEDYIWILYIGIIILSWYSNNLERQYLISKKHNYKEQYRRVLVLIFSILLIVYLYFLKSSIDDVKKIKPTDSREKTQLKYLSLVASLFISISGFILLYIAIQDKDINVELAFN